MALQSIQINDCEQSTRNYLMFFLVARVPQRITIVKKYTVYISRLMAFLVFILFWSPRFRPCSRRLIFSGYCVDDVCPVVRFVCIKISKRLSGNIGCKDKSMELEKVGNGNGTYRHKY